jgi:hypothetical protein
MMPAAQPSVSVCMPYFERRDELERSMRAYEAIYDDIELSIVDDRSYPSLVLPETGLDVVFSRLDGEKGAKNPCVPMNIAVNQSKHDVIVLTGPEIQHTGDIFTAMLEKLGPMTYVTAKCIEPSGKQLVPRQRQHNIPENSGFHFCTMLTRELWDLAGGFDENYRDGQGHEDVDWLYTLESVGATFVMVDETVIHHPTKTFWPRGGHKRNRDYLRKKWNLS